MFLRKIFRVIVVAAIVGAFVALVGCSDKTAEETLGAPVVETLVSKNPNAEDADMNSFAAYAAGSKFYVTLNGVDVSIHMPFADCKEALGGAEDLFESESCAGQGMDKVYTYKNVVIRTFTDEDGNETITSIEFRDDTVVTSTNCYIGMDVDTVKAQHDGFEPSSDTETALSYVDGDCKISYMLTDGEVTAITYN